MKLTHPASLLARLALPVLALTMTMTGPAAAARDRTRPIVSITSPLAGSMVSGSVTVAAAASDNVGITKVDFYVDAVLKATDTSYPYGFAWDTRAHADGLRNLTAKAYDPSKNSRSSSAVQVVVSNLSSSCPGTPIAAGSDIQGALSGGAVGASFCLKSGIHRLAAPLVPRDSQSITGEAGAIINGALPVGSWSLASSVPKYWIASGQTAESAPVGDCDPAGYMGCRYNEQLFYDDSPLRRVESPSQITSGTFYFDYAADRIYLGSDPTGHKLEVATARSAFAGSGVTGVSLSKLTVEKFANPAQTAAIETGRNWTVDRCDVRLNHGVGIRGNSYNRLTNNHVHHQGQMGLAGSGSAMLVENNEIDHNNTAGFDWYVEAGGSKWVWTEDMVVRGNYSHDNIGPGLWTDINNIRTIYEGNRVEYNSGPGIDHEISYDAVIRNNTLKSNATGLPGLWWGAAGIFISASSNVEVYGNTLTDNGGGIGLMQTSRGDGYYGPHELGNIQVHDNVVTMRQGVTGLVQNVGDLSYFTSRGISFVANTYYLAGTTTPYFEWMDARRTANQWVGFGNDTGGRFFYI